jgi:hypothetical protein
MSYVSHDGPDFVVIENAVRAWHSRWPQSVFDHPKELTVAVGLHGLRSQRGQRRRHRTRKRDSCALAVEAMANVAVVRKTLFSLENVLRVCRQRISRIFVPNKESVLRGGYYQCFKLACGLCGSATREKKQASRQRQQHTTGTHRDNSLVHVIPRQRLLDHVDLEDHRSVSRATEVRTLAREMARFCGCQRYFAVFAFFDFCCVDT